MVKKVRSQSFEEPYPYEEIIYEINDNEVIICRAEPGTARATAEWQIYKKTTAVIVGATETVLRYANNNAGYIFSADSTTALSLVFTDS